MNVHNLPRYVAYTATAGQTVFAFNFGIFADTDLAVSVDGVDVTYAEPAVGAGQYAVNFVPGTEGGTIVFGAGLTLGQVVEIESRLGIDFLTPLPTTGPLNISALNAQIEKVAAWAQEVQQMLAAAVRVPANDALGRLPDGAGRAGRILAFDGTGDIDLILASDLDGVDALNPNFSIAANTVPTGQPATAMLSGTYPDLLITLGLPIGATGSGSSVSWGGVLGTLSNQVDLQNALNAKAATAGPTFTGTVTIPTPTPGDNSTKAASTAFVTTALLSYATLASPALTGTPTAPTAAPGTNTTQIATTAFVTASFAKLASPAFTGTPTVNGAEIGFRDFPIVAKGSAFTFADSDRGKMIVYSGAAAAATINPSGTTPINVGGVIAGFNNGSGILTITPGAGVSLYANGSPSSGSCPVAVKGEFVIKQMATNVWTVSSSA